MHLDKRSNSLALLLTLLSICSLPLWQPDWNWMPFTPWIIILIYNESLVFCLWASLGAGLLIDLLCYATPLGFCALTYTLTTAIVFPQRRHFFADSITTLPIMISLFTFLASLQQLLLLLVLKENSRISIYHLGMILIYSPVANALFGFTLFVLPYLLFGKKQRAGKDYFFERKSYEN